MTKTHSRIIFSLNSKGGSGNTAATVALADFLIHNLGLNPKLVDCDLANKTFGSLSHVFKGTPKLDVRAETGLDDLLAIAKPAELEEEKAAGSRIVFWPTLGAGTRKTQFAGSMKCMMGLSGNAPVIDMEKRAQNIQNELVNRGLSLRQAIDAPSDVAGPVLGTFAARVRTRGYAARLEEQFATVKATLMPDLAVPV